MRSSIAFFAWLCTVASALAVDPGKYEWDQDRKLSVLAQSDANKPVLVLKHHVQYDYAHEDGDFVMYSTMHRIVYTNSNEAVKKHNQIFISMDANDRLTGLKARTISKTGKVILFDESNLKEVRNEESGLANRIFAIEGAEVGGEIEYYYTKRSAGHIYVREFAQFESPVNSVSFQLTCPKHLKFDFRSYNGLAEVKQEEDTTANVYSLKVANIPGLQEEQYAFYGASRMRIEFKLAYNTARSKARLYTWDDAAKRFYSEVMTTSKDDDRALSNFISTLWDNPSMSEADRIRAVEDKIKMTIRVNTDANGPQVTEPYHIIKNKVAAEKGMTRLFMGVFGKLGIPCQLAMTCSRDHVRFDKSFDSWSYLEDYLLYFPNQKTFLAPYHETRYPLVPAGFTSQHALFVEELTLGEQKSALGSIGLIPEVPYQLNEDNLEIDVRFGASVDSNIVHQIRTFKGYSALYFTPYYRLLDDQRRTLLMDEILKQTAPDVKVNKWTAKVVDNDTINQFIVETDFITAHFTERAGNKILFKAGLLIGPQSEMYREDTRKQDIENTSNRGFMRVIRVHVPQGYMVRNLDALKIDVVFDNTVDPPCLFRSDYRMNGEMLEIKITELYKRISFPRANYEDFRRVVNAAADFNKVVLVLEKL